MFTAHNHYSYSIERSGGLEKHLNNTTEPGYAPFDQAMQQGITVNGRFVKRATIADLARLYGRDRRTIRSWIEMYRRQHGKEGHHE